jgi:glycosyltransferase involved in cell wall biosynthesis
MVTQERIKFLFVFDAKSSVERKTPEGLINAFAEAFKDTRYAKRATLTLKLAGMGYPEYAARLQKLMQMASRSGLDIRFDGRELGREELLLLIAKADCYVSLHRAEGLGYTMAEAMFYGVPVIASGYSGNLE